MLCDVVRDRRLGMGQYVAERVIFTVSNPSCRSRKRLSLRDAAVRVGRDVSNGANHPNDFSSAVQHGASTVAVRGIYVADAIGMLRSAEGVDMSHIARDHTGGDVEVGIPGDVYGVSGCQDVLSATERVCRWPPVTSRL